MENAVDALKMAGAVLIFVLAISIIILSFGQVRQTADIILDYKDRETTYIYYEDKGQTVRTVNLETIIPAIFRAYLENYKIVFQGLEEEIYTIVQSDGTIIKKNSIDLNDGILAGNEKKAEFLCGILYNDFKSINVPSYFSSMTQEEYFKEKNFGIKIRLPNKSLYKQLQGKTIKEYLGVYYDNDAPNIPDAMKEEKRIITYIIE